MIKIRTLILSATMLLCATALGAQTIEKTFVRSFNLMGANEMILRVEGPVEVKTWSQSIARVQVTVQLENGTESMLRSLAQAGRYTLNGELHEGQYVADLPGMEREVLINGNPLGEHLSYVVFVPEGVRLNVENSSSAAGF